MFDKRASLIQQIDENNQSSLKDFNRLSSIEESLKTGFEDKVVLSPERRKELEKERAKIKA